MQNFQNFSSWTQKIFNYIDGFLDLFIESWDYSNLQVFKGIWRKLIDFNIENFTTLLHFTLLWVKFSMIWGKQRFET